MHFTKEPEMITIIYIIYINESEIVIMHVQVIYHRVYDIDYLRKVRKSSIVKMIVPHQLPVKPYIKLEKL